MTYQFRLREEPFEFNSELDHAEKWLSTELAETWQGEVSRKSPDYVRWVQRSLNQILGLQLAVDGVLGRPTRSTVRSFQQRQGLAVDGVVGEKTERALVAAGAKPPPLSRTPSQPQEPPIPGPVTPLGRRCRFRFPPRGVEIPGSGRIKDKTPPQNVVEVKGVGDRRIPLHPLAAEAWKALVGAARSDGIPHPLFLPTSGFRDPEHQRRLWEQALKKYGSPQAARKWVAPPGSSPHQSGRAIDFYLGGENSSGNVANLRRLPAYKWLVENAGCFGFYPYEAEPWHWEYNPPGKASRELEELESFYAELAGLEREVEVGRSSLEYIRWVQQSLNKILGLRLAADGIMGPATRSAIRSFQQRRALAVDGVVGPRTDAAIKQALGSTPTTPYPANANCEVLDRFNFDKDQLKPFHQPQLAKVATQVVASQRTRQPIRKIHITGHTDVAGEDRYNLGLGQRRADQARTGLIAAIERMKPGASRSVVITTASKGELNPISKDNPRNRRVEICPDTSTIKPPQPKPPQPKPPQPTPPCVPPADVNAMILVVNNLLRSLPLGMIGVKLPTAARCLTPAEQSFAMGTYAGSLDFTKILIADGLGAEGRPFTVAVPTSVGWHVVMLLGDISRRWVGSGTLIHELAHAWQSQHHGSDPTAYMKNSVECQVKALADIPIAKAAAAAAAVEMAIASGVFDPRTLASIGSAAAGRESSSSYAYVPGKSFGAYAAEQIAQQVEDSFNRTGRPTPGVLSVMRSVSANVPSADNRASLSVISFHRKSTPGVVFH